MRMSQAFGKTLREAPADAEMTSHKLLIRANFIRPLAAGIYTFMPLGYRVLRKIWTIMAEEMDAIGGQEMWMPNIHPPAIWEATGRGMNMRSVLYKARAESGREYFMSPTHEEVVNELTLSEVDSHRDLPRVVYHITKKFRDEPLKAFRTPQAVAYHTLNGCIAAFALFLHQAHHITGRDQILMLPIDADDLNALPAKSLSQVPPGTAAGIECTVTIETRPDEQRALVLNDDEILQLARWATASAMPIAG